MEESPLYKMVTEMHRHEMGVKSKLGLGRLARKMLRLLRADAEYPASSFDQEAYAATPANISYDSHREMRSALLNAERRKAEAFMEWQKHRIIC